MRRSFAALVAVATLVATGLPPPGAAHDAPPPAGAPAPAPGAGPAAPPAGGPAAPPPGPARAPKPPPPATSEQAADAVLAAVAANDDAALEALAGKDDPDPWLVADELIRRGQHDAADAFGRAAPRADTEALPAYVASRRGTPDDPARRERLARANEALGAGKPAAALDALGSAEPGAPEDVVGVRIAFVRGSALRSLRRLDDAATAFLSVGEAAERLGWLVRASRAFRESGETAYRGSALAVARGAWERWLRVCERRGTEAGAAAAMNNLGLVHESLGEYEKALSYFDRALAAKEAAGDEKGAATTLGNIGLVHNRLGNYAEALSFHGRALAANQTFGDKAGVARALGNIGLVHFNLGDYAEALSFHERALAAKQALGDEAGAATTLVNLGSAHFALGDHAQALSILERALALNEALGNRDGAAATLGNLGLVHAAMGAYAKAMSFQERALAAHEALGDRAGAALTLGNLGVLESELGDHAKALSSHERALAAKEALGDKAGAALTLGNIGLVHQSLDDYAQALAFHERALAAKVALGDKAGAARTLASVGIAQFRLGDLAKALSSLERALAAQEALRDRAGAATTLRNIGVVLEARGDLAGALSAYERVLAAEEALADRAGAGLTLGRIGGARHRLGDHAKAVAAAHDAVGRIAATSRGLAPSEATGARERLTFVYDVGILASMALGDAREVAAFLESGRAGALLEGLAAREALWSAAVPEALRAAEVKARAAETRATAALRKALDAGDLAATKARRAELEAVQERVAAVVARIQREAKAGAAIVYPRAASLDEIRATLDAGDALVLYALLPKEAVALVVGRDGARIVPLGPRDAVDAAAEAAAEALADPEVDAGGSLAALADLVVKPLALPASAKRVLVSPSGALSYVPFAALLPDRTLAYAASGTTYRLLREEEALRGEGVLALGDPDYESKVDARALAMHRGATGRLARLPATRDEALAVGTTTLLGADATEARLREALAERKRWRAVHLACHGLVDTERPALSSLAITPAGDDDGFLTCLDVFRMQVPADLVVLSACETGKGRVVKGEGIVGLTRAFMFAGTPRVVCSLWKVDDEATRALMAKFYELWNPQTGSTGVGTAEALRAAQEHVKLQAKWKHPYYWAAWVLWGLPS